MTVVVTVLAASLIISPTRRYTTALACLLLGFVWATIDAGLRLSVRLQPGLHNTDHLLSGIVTGLVRQSGTTVSFSFRTVLPGHQKPARVALRWYEYDSLNPLPQPGQTWQLALRLRQPRGLANPGQSSFSRFAFRSQIAATGYIRKGQNRLLSDARRWRLDALRNRLSGDLASALSDYQSGALIVALAVGDRQYISDTQWRVVRRNGLSHLLAISGLHIGMIALSAYWLGAKLGSLFNRGIGIGCLSGATGAVIYAALAGFTIPTQRALIVVMTLLLLRWRRRDARPTQSLAIALWLIVLIDPVAVLDSGFWLSFCAVGLILYVSVGLNRTGHWRHVVSLQFKLCLGLAPLVVLLFGEVSLIAPLINLIAVPLASLIIVPLTLSGTLLAGCCELQFGLPLLRTGAILLDSVWPELVFLARSPLSSWMPGGAPLTVALLAMTGTLWWLAPAGWPARRLGLIMLLPLFSWQPPSPEHGSVQLSLLDVGHGMAVVVRTRRNVLIYDTGPAWRSGNNAALRIVIPFLQHLRIDNPQRLIVSHADSDHAGGLSSLIAHFPDITIIASGLNDYDACLRGDRWFWDGVSFDVLHPDSDKLWSDNNASCVLRITAGRHCVLLTGDIEAAAEQVLVAREQSLVCDVVIAPHHGSETSSTKAFVDATGAQQVLFSTGYANRWDFPRPAVQRRWRRSGARIYDTGRDGALSVTLSATGGIEIRGYRCGHRRLWSPPCHSSL